MKILIESPLFQNVYLRHMNALGLEKRKSYTLDKIIDIKWVPDEKAFHVFYANEEWYHYTSSGEWY